MAGAHCGGQELATGLSGPMVPSACLVVRCSSRLFFGCLGRGNALLSFLGTFKVTMKLVAAEFLTLWAFLGFGGEECRESFPPVTPLTAPPQDPLRIPSASPTIPNIQGPSNNLGRQTNTPFPQESPPPAPHGPWAHPLPLTAPRTSAAESSSATANQTVRRPTEMAQTRGSHCTITAACRPSGRGLGDQLGYKWGGGGFGKKPWYCILVCRWRRPLADRHSQVGGGGVGHKTVPKRSVGGGGGESRAKSPWNDTRALGGTGPQRNKKGVH